MSRYRPTKNNKKKHTVTHEECVTFLDGVLKQDGPINLNEHRVQEELQLCFAHSTADHRHDHVQIVGLRDWHVDRYITDGCVSKLIKCKEGRKIEQNGKVKKIKQPKKNKIQVKVIGTGRSVYKVAIKFKSGVIPNIFRSTRDIKKCQCDGCGINKKCRHVAAVLFALSDDSHLQQRLQTNSHSHYHESKDAHHIGDCCFSKKTLPASYPGPELAFAGKCSTILDWSTHKKYGDKAAALTYMFAKAGSIDYHAPECTHPQCNKKMKFHEDTLNWQCHSYINGKQHNRQIALLAKSRTTFFDFIASTQLGLFTAFLVYYFNPNTATNAAAQFCGMSNGVAYKWALKIRELCGVANKKFKIKLGDGGSTIEMDGTYLGRIWKYHKMGMPINWGQTVWFRIIERDWTAKGRHRRRTFIVKAESVKDCLPLLLEHCKTNKDCTNGEVVKLMADGCGFGAAKKLKEYFQVAQCNHKKRQFVNPTTVKFDAHSKVHDNTAG